MHSYIFYVEALLKIFAMSPIGYFKDRWCAFEFTLVAFALFDQLGHQVLIHYLPVPPMLLRVLRMARILRVMRILKGIKGLRNLLWTLVFSGPSLLNGGHRATRTLGSRMRQPIGTAAAQIRRAVERRMGGWAGWQEAGDWQAG